MRAEKKYIVQEAESHLKKSDYVILANYSTVTVAETAELRKELRAENAEFHVVKNSALRVAAKQLGLPEFEDSAYVGPTAILVGGDNPAGVAKILKKFFEDKKKLEIKVGIMDSKVVSAQELMVLASLPGFKELRAQFLSLLKASASAFVRVLDAKAKKEEAPAA